MAVFSIAYSQWIQPAEGGYGWLPGDTGGETYAGISRVYNPKWQGWPAIDFEKHRLKVDKLKNNVIVPGVQGMVTDYYNSMWKQYGFDKVKNQDVANIVYDFLVNSGAGNVQGVVGPLVGKTKIADIIPALNVSDSAKLHDQIKNARIEFFKKIAKKPGQEAFLKGWLNRINKFPNLTTAIKIGVPVIVVLVVATIIILTYGKS